MPKPSSICYTHSCDYCIIIIKQSHLKIKYKSQFFYYLQNNSQIYTTLFYTKNVAMCWRKKNDGIWRCIYITRACLAVSHFRVYYYYIPPWMRIAISYRAEAISRSLMCSRRKKKKNFSAFGNERASSWWWIGDFSSDKHKDSSLSLFLWSFLTEYGEGTTIIIMFIWGEWWFCEIVE